MSNYLGIDIGGTNVEFGIVNEAGEIVFSDSFSTREYGTPEELANDIQGKIKSNHKEPIEAVGVGAPSVNLETEKIEYAPNLDWGDIVPIKEIFEEVFKVPVYVSNDANAYALGVKVFGEAQDLDSFAVVTLGTGVGLGCYINGGLVEGTNGLAGEIGHFVVHRGGRECKCGNLGCLETYAGAAGIVMTAKEKLEFSSGGSMLNNVSPSDITPLEVFNAARKDDPVALEVVDAVSHDLGYALSGLINLLDIENIYLTGGITKAGNILKRKTEKHLKSYVLPNLRSRVNLKITSLNQTGGNILGAVSIIKDLKVSPVNS